MAKGTLLYFQQLCRQNNIVYVRNNIEKGFKSMAGYMKRTSKAPASCVG